ncbi:hypothetical protein DU258_04260 [Salmonella enterica subsp. enterica]|uniref:Periplasmic protein n=1 Tax=Salmonella enterica subsp. enterica serovar Macclesfield str. S-1643 TaxID=1242107 RepID=A0A2C9P3Y9_SALET|nr:hypothetical protein [Salmonella enterica]EAA5485292.1 hypothetical protein [Salmonella enterica subsp. enterica serovar Kouka]EBG2392664.1 hypothetical protein [Salmonella enterica subsp. enterica serovar Everleigh]EBS1106263.1 hypothetical protein [Salmonella enterica subsp. enterica serovar Eingedi]EBV2192354.1 hypothetical protein [Salmonella enterica subsp. enterica serovar Afula]ECH9258160.1 hypothetical protein [Salmonella enterica subsp. enterica]
MKKSPLCCYLFCAAMSASSAALAATAPVSAGVIHFKGQIVEYGCNLAPHDRNIEVSCLRNNIPHLQTVATPSGNAISLMNGIATVRHVLLKEHPEIQSLIVQYR